MKQKSITTIIIFSIVLLSITGFNLNNPIRQTDESTLFGEVLKMYNGYQIYKEINALVTPLFFYIGLCIFKLFGATYLIFRIYAIAIWMLLFFSVFVLMKKLKVSDAKIIITLLGLLIFLKDIVIGASYNALGIALSIFGIVLQVSNTKNRKHKFYILQGILAFFIIMTKQTIGIYYLIAFILSDIIIHKKIKIKSYIITTLPIICGSIAFAILLILQNNSLYDFVNYTILGMKEFQQNFKIETYIILLALVNIIIVVYKIIKKQVDNNLIILFVYSLVMLLLTYPIICDFHSRQALIFSTISFVYCIPKEVDIQYKWCEKTIIVVLAILLIYVSYFNLKNWKENQYYTYDDPYFGVVYNKKMDMRINTVVDYLKENKNAIIISPEATLYNVKLNINNGILDLPLKGNVGINGEQRIIDEIEKLKNKKLIITKYIYDQEYSGVHEYIINRYKKVDTIAGIFEVYEKEI